jgi:hypothetical protein
MVVRRWLTASRNVVLGGYSFGLVGGVVFAEDAAEFVLMVELGTGNNVL